LTETREATAIPTMGFLRWCWEAITTGMVEMMETTMEVWMPGAGTVMAIIVVDHKLAKWGIK
jgi:hypothetical protein